MKVEKITYSEGGAALEAHVVRPDGDAKRPAVLVSHAWAGQSDFERTKAEKLAELGYVGVALDNYGRGVLGEGKDECSRLMGPFMQDRAKLQRRLLAGVEMARSLPGVDTSRLAAIGFCFGGLCVLDLARAGVGLRGVVSFHGLLKPGGLAKRQIASKVLVLHGHDDPMAPPAHVQALASELGDAGADFQIHLYGRTMHAFTNPDANDPGFGTVYDATADARSWIAMKSFLEEVLA